MLSGYTWQFLKEHVVLGIKPRKPVAKVGMEKSSQGPSMLFLITLFCLSFKSRVFVGTSPFPCALIPARSEGTWTQGHSVPLGKCRRSRKACSNPHLPTSSLIPPWGPHLGLAESGDYQVCVEIKPSPQILSSWPRQWRQSPSRLQNEVSSLSSQWKNLVKSIALRTSTHQRPFLCLFFPPGLLFLTHPAEKA